MLARRVLQTSVLLVICGFGFAREREKRSAGPALSVESVWSRPPSEDQLPSLALKLRRPRCRPPGPDALAPSMRPSGRSRRSAQSSQEPWSSVRAPLEYEDWQVGGLRAYAGAIRPRWRAWRGPSPSGMLDVLVDGERLLPGLSRPRQFTGGVAVSPRWVRASASVRRSPSSRAMLSARW